MRTVMRTVTQDEGVVAAPSSKPAETILLVDDDPEVLSLAADILRAAGYTVLSTGDPGEALRIARTRRERLHLLLTDVVMPLMSGRQLAEELRAIRSEVKVLFMSAYSIEIVEDYLILLAPGEPFVVKPFTMAELRRKVRAALEYRSPFSRPRVQ
jgi:two-component system, cell cycle sensor histidine kinase and response regulator CckA